MFSALWCVRGEVARITKLTQNWRVFELTKLYIISNYGTAFSVSFSHNLTKNQGSDDSEWQMPVRPRALHEETSGCRLSPREIRQGQ